MTSLVLQWNLFSLHLHWTAEILGRLTGFTSFQIWLCCHAFAKFQLKCLSTLSLFQFMAVDIFVQKGSHYFLVFYCIAADYLWDVAKVIGEWREKKIDVCCYKHRFLSNFRWSSNSLSNSSQWKKIHSYLKQMHKLSSLNKTLPVDIW